MHPSAELALASYFNQSGKLASPTTASEWDRPKHVELAGTSNYIAAVVSGSPILEFGAELRIRKQPHEAKMHARVVRPNPDLLEKFLGLAFADDTKIRNFASRFGSLEIFSDRDSIDNGGTCVEYCNVWRYFALVMTALLKLAARARADGKDSEADWILIGMAPKVIRDWYNRQSSGQRLSDDPEILWSAMVFFIRERKERDRKMLLRLLNTLLELGQVRPWVLWPEDAGRPRVVYSSPRLLSYLALQLCLRVGGLDAFVVCHHCRKEYAPPQRAPKANQRNFCPECREAGIPQKYALKDHREKKRSSNNG